jgi:two-component system, chemotaxis family, chemotaxis protein CheY
MKFIVIDDDEISLLIARRLLADVLRVTNIETFDRAGEALRFLQRDNGCETISVLLDLNMPVISGWDFLDFFNQFQDSLKNRVHIYVVTSSANPADRLKAFTHPNVICFISKPLTRTVIKETFGDYLSTEELRK